MIHLQLRLCESKSHFKNLECAMYFWGDPLAGNQTHDWFYDHWVESPAQNGSIVIHAFRYSRCMYGRLLSWLPFPALYRQDKEAMWLEHHKAFPKVRKPVAIAPLNSSNVQINLRGERISLKELWMLLLNMHLDELGSGFCQIWGTLQPAPVYCWN